MTLTEVAQSAGISHEEFIKECTIVFLHAAIGSTNKKGVLRIDDITSIEGDTYTLWLKKDKK